MPTDGIQLAAGGCAANAGLDLAKVGVRVGVSGCVGDDAFGQFIIKPWPPATSTSGIHRLAGISTASTMVVNVKGQDRRFISTPAARFTVDHIPAEWVRQARSSGRLPDDAGAGVRRPGGPLSHRRAAGTKTVLDVVLFGGTHYWDALTRILPETDVFLPNDDEAALITGLGSSTGAAFPRRRANRRDHARQAREHSGLRRSVPPIRRLSDRLRRHRLRRRL